MEQVNVLLLSRDRQSEDAYLTVEASKVGNASLVTHKGQHYSYCGIKMGRSPGRLGLYAEFMRCDPPVELP